jgi:hypothetical protein
MFKLRFGLCTGTLLAAYLVCSSQAHAQGRDGRRQEGNHFALALDFDYGTDFSSDLIEDGGGGTLRLGFERDMVLITLIPELTLGYHAFSGVGRYDAQIYDGMLGGRIRFLKVVEPGVYMHAGIGHIDGFASHTGFAMDIGATLDFTLLPIIEFGIHGAWNRVFAGSDEDGLSYGTAGVHVALVI